MTTPTPFEFGQMVSQNYAEPIRQTFDINALNKIFDQAKQGGMSEQDLMTQVLSKVSPQNRESAAKLLQNEFMSLPRREKVYEKLGYTKEIARLPPDERKIALQNQFQGKALEQKQQQEVQKEQREQQETKTQIQELRDDISYTGYPIFSGIKPLVGKIPGTEAHRKRKGFEKSSIWITDKIFSHFNKGTISKPKLELIVKDLAPHPDLSQSENLARLDALDRAIGLPRDATYNDLKSIIGEKSESKKPPLESFFK
jgi:hypothetical protein